MAEQKYINIYGLTDSNGVVKYIGYSSIYLMECAVDKGTICRSCLLTGRVISDETKHKMSQSMKGIKKSDTSNMGATKKVVLQQDLNGEIIKEWVSISKAEKELQIFGITKVCKGYRKTAGNFKWKYKNE